MDKVLKVSHSQTRDGRPLATIRNFPGLDADLYPEQLRAMAAALLAAADDCTARKIDKKRFRQIERAYPLL